MSDFIVDPPESSCEPEELGGASLTSAVTYDGLDLSCLGVTSGIDMNAVLQALEISCQNKLSQISVLNVRVTTLENEIAGLQSQTVYTTDVNDLGAYNCISTTGILSDTLSSIDDAICALQATTGSNRLLQSDFDKYIANTGKPFVYKEELGTGAILSTGVNTATLDNLDGFATADGKTAYVTGAAVTLVSSRDNYIYADSSTGTFIVKDVPLGNPAPAELSSEIILHCLTTDGTGAVIAQLDLRQYNSIDETYFRLDTDVSAFIPEDSITGFHIDLTTVLSYDSVVAITNPADIVHKDYVDNAISLVAPLWTAAGSDIYFNTGNVGIGNVADGTANLYVDGSLRYTDGNELNGKVLVCDDNGYATWSTPQANAIVLEEGVDIGGTYNTFNFIGDSVTATDAGGGIVDINIVGGAGGGATYLNPDIVPQTVGGFLAGQPAATTTLSLQEFGDKLLFPYQAPVFTSFVLSGYSTLEVGDSITAGSQTFNWSTSNSSNVEANTLDIIDVTNGNTALATDIANDGSEVVTLPLINKTTATSHVFRVQAENTNTVLFNRNYTVNWRHKRYWGTHPDLSAPSDGEILAADAAGVGSGKEFSTTRVQTRNNINGGGNHIFFAFPTSFGTPTFVINGLPNTAWTKIRSASAFVNSVGHSEPYDVWISNTPQFSPISSFQIN
jgi:hypothetical protein